MTESQKEILLDAGYDIKGAIARFAGNADLYMMFLKKYVDDDNMSKIIAALEVENYTDAYAAAHALKGVSGNLGITDVFECSKDFLALVKGKTAEDGIKDDAIKLCNEFKAKNDEAVKIISEL